MKRTPLLNPDLVLIRRGAMAGTIVMACKRPPDAETTKMPVGTIAIRTSTGYTTYLDERGSARGWYALPAWEVERVAKYLHDHHPNFYRQINWEGSGL